MIVGEYVIKDGRVLDATKRKPRYCIHGRRLKVAHPPAVLCHTCAYEVAKLSDVIIPPEITDTDPL